MDDLRDEGAKPPPLPANRVTRVGLRRAEMALFCLLLLALSALLIRRGVVFLLAGEPVAPLGGLVLPVSLGAAAGALFLLLGTGIALATLVMAAHFRR